MSQNILLVDDEEMVTRSLQKLLEKKGYNVTVADSGHEAVELAELKDFNLIITDIRMPKLDGISTIKIIRKLLEDKGKKKVPEILITGYALEEYMHEAERLNVADCLYKPINIWDLLRSIKKALGQKT